MAKPITLNPTTFALAKEVQRRYDSTFARIPNTERGTVIAVSYAKPENGGQVTKVNISLQNGTVLTNVAAAGYVVGKGAHVEIEGTDAVMGASWRIRRVLNTGPGAQSSEPTAPLSTPYIMFVRTRLEGTPSGGQQIVIDFMTECVVEQWRGRVPTRYKIELYSETLQLVQTITTVEQEKVGGKITSNLLAGVTSVGVYQQGGTNPPNFNFPVIGVLRVENEYMLYESAGYNGTTQSWILGVMTRAFAGTSDVTHYAPREAVLGGQVLTTDALIPNTVYKARVRAESHDGRTSNWSDLVTVLSTLDTTAPSWSGTTGLKADSIGSAFNVKWKSADLNADDLDHYNIQISEDGSTWIDDPDHVLNGGNGNSWTYNSIPGKVMYFRINAEDWTGNRAYKYGPYVEWSPSVRGILPLTEEPTGTPIVFNGTFTGNITDWTRISTTDTPGPNTASIAYDATRYFASSAGSMKFQETRLGIQSTTELRTSLKSVGAGNWLYFRGYFQGANLNANDEVRLVVEYTDGAAITNPAVTLKGSDFLTGDDWTPVYFTTAIPAGVTQIRLMISITVMSGSGTMNVWVDDMVATLFNQGASPFVTTNTYNFSNNPGTNARQLETTSGGKLTLADFEAKKALIAANADTTLLDIVGNSGTPTNPFLRISRNGQTANPMLFVSPFLTGDAGLGVDRLIMNAPTSTSTLGNTFNLSTRLRFVSTYWNGLANTEESMELMMFRSAATANNGQFQIRTPGGSILFSAAVNNRLGVFGVTPIARTAAYTQTYATVTRTMTYSSDIENVAYTAATSGVDPLAKLADLNALRLAYENVRAFSERIAQMLNSVIDDFQAYGWLQ